MKRKILGLLVVALAVSLSAYTNLPKKEATGYYWFPLESYSGNPQMVNTLVYSPSDPYLCTSWAPGGYCTGAFTSYSGTRPPYSAAGVEMIVDYSMFY